MASEVGGFERSIKVGVTIGEQEGPAAWAGQGSHPTWVIGEGHMPIEEARAKALADLVDKETDVDKKRKELADAITVRSSAIRRVTQCEQALDEARLALAYAQLDLARRCGVVELPAPSGEQEDER